MTTDFYFVNQTQESLSWDGFTTADVKRGLVLIAQTARFTAEEIDWFLRLTMTHLHSPRVNSPTAVSGVSSRLKKRAIQFGLLDGNGALTDDQVFQTLLRDNVGLVEEIAKRAQQATLLQGHRHHLYVRDMDQEQM